MSEAKEARLDLTKGPIGRQIVQFTVPLLLGIAVLLGVLSIVLFNVTSRQFQPERLFTTCQES